jgi:hypothetical protein
MMRLTDDELLDLLGAAFAPTRLEPPASRLVALRRTLAQQSVVPIRRRVAAVQHGVRRASMLLAASGLVVGGATAAAAATGNLPQTIRSLAHEIGVGTPAPPRPTLTDQLAELRAALADKDYGKAQQISRALERNAARLSDAERTEVHAQITQEFEHAVVDSHSDDVSAPAPDHPNTTSPATTPDAPADASPVDTSAGNPSENPTTNAPTDAPSDPASAPDATAAPPNSEPSPPTPSDSPTATPAADTTNPVAP